MIEKDRAIMSGVYRTANGCGDHPGWDVHICWPEEMISEVAETNELSNPAKKELSKVLWKSFKRVHSYECKLRAIFREWREGKIGDGDFDRKAEIYHREEFKRRYELVGMEQHMIAPFEGEMEEDEFAGELGEVLREALLKDCPQDQLPPEPAMRLVLERTKGMGGYNAREIRLLGQPGHPASLEFTWDVIATVRKRALEEELKRAVTE